MSAFLPVSAFAAGDQQPDSSQDIIVTAQRRAERLEDVPMSVAAATQATLENAGVSDMHDLDQLTPGVQISFTGAHTQPAIRGVTTLTAGGGWENNVAVYVDGFYTPNTIALNMGLANIQDIQIFKGPQGTLYGRNATGGAILINTLSPSDTLTANLELGYARFNDVTANAYVSGPLSDGLRIGIAGSLRKGDGYYRAIDRNGTGREVGNAAPLDQQALRIKLEADLGQDVTATLAYNYGKTDDPTTLLFPNQGYAPSFLPGEPLAARAPFRASSGVQTRNEATTHEGTLKLVYKSPIGDLVSYTGYANRRDRTAYDFDGTYFPILEITSPWDEHTFQQTVDLAIDAVDRLDLVIGASYYDDKTSNMGSHTYSGGTDIGVSYARLTTRAWAAYFDATYELADHFHVNVGGRYTHERKGIGFRQVDAATGTINLLPPASSSTTFSDFIPRVTLRYEVAASTNIYASVSQGFRSGGFQPTPVSDPSLVIPYRPEKITAYEVGFKTAQSGFRFDLAAFYYEYTDLQVGVTRANQATNSLISFVSNAPSAEIYGLDVQATVEPVRKLTLTAGASFLHARYKNFPGITGIGLDAATNVNVEDVQDWSGLQMTRAPNFSGNVAASYEVPLATGALRLSGNVSYNGASPQSNPSVYGDRAGPALARVQRYKNDAYTLVNGQIAWTDPSDHLTLTIFCNNITDERYYINYGGTTYFGDVGVFNQPRTFGGKIKYRY